MTHPTFYTRLLSDTEQARTRLYATPQLQAGLRGEISKQTYIGYLTQAYHHVRHTVPLLMAMGSRLDASHLWLQSALCHYIDEEQGHEEWILNDIAAAGGDRDAVRLSEPHLATQCLVAYNYDYVHRKNPIGFLGMVFMLESTSVQIATQGAAALQSRLNLPASALTYLTSHGAIDESHLAFYAATVNQLDIADDHAAIIEVANNTFALFAGVFNSIPLDQEIADVA